MVCRVGQGVVLWAGGSSLARNAYLDRRLPRSVDATISLTWVRWRAWNWSTVDCSKTLRSTRTEPTPPELGQCKTLLRQQLLSQPGAPGDVIVCESCQQGGGALPREIKDARSWRYPLACWARGCRSFGRRSSCWCSWPRRRGGRKGKRGGRGRGPVAMTSLVEGGRSAVRPPQNKGRLAATERGNLFFAAASSSSRLVFWVLDRWANDADFHVMSTAPVVP